MHWAGWVFAFSLGLAACSPATSRAASPAADPVTVQNEKPFETSNGPVCTYDPDAEEDDEANPGACETLPAMTTLPGAAKRPLHERPDARSPIVTEMEPGESVSKLDNAFLIFKSHRGVVRAEGSGLKVGQIVWPSSPFESDSYPFKTWDDPADQDYTVRVEGDASSSETQIYFNEPGAAQIAWEKLRPEQTLEHWILLKRADGTQGWTLNCSNPPDTGCARTKWTHTEAAPQSSADWVMSFVFHGGVINQALFSQDGRHVATFSADASVRLWNAQTGENTNMFTIDGAVRLLAISPDGARLIVAQGDGTASVWSAAGDKLFALQAPSGGIGRAGFSTDGKEILTGPGSSDAEQPIEAMQTQVWDAATGAPLRTLSTALMNASLSGASSGQIASPDGRRIAHIDWDTVQVRDAATGADLFVINLMMKHESLFSVAYSPDGATIITGDERGRAKVWDAVTGGFLFELFPYDKASPHYRPGPVRPIESVAISPDGRQILTVGRGAVHLWSANQP